MGKQWVDFRSIRQELSFDDVLSHYGIKAGKGDDFKIPCPFHDDKRPSCSINTSKGIFNCFSCSAKGNVLDFVTLMNRGDPRNSMDVRKGALVALDILGADTSKKAKKRRKSKPKKRKKKMRKADPAKLKSSRESPKVSTALFGEKTSYKPDSQEETPEEPAELVPLTFQLKLSPSHPMLRDRGISTALAEEYEIGFCSRGMMKGRICFPLRDAEGHIVAYSGRYAETAGQPLPEGESRYKLPKGFPKQRVLFNLDRAVARLNDREPAHIGHVVVVEGFWSAIMLDQLGISAVACLGASLSDEQVNLLRSASVHYATVLFDGDEAGLNGSFQAVSRLGHSGMWSSGYRLAEGLSPEDMTRDELTGLML